jgi:hypothetical protein
MRTHPRHPPQDRQPAELEAAFDWPLARAEQIRSQQHRQRGWKLYPFHAPEVECIRVASEMEIEDGVLWVYGVGEDGIRAFTDFGIENLIELVRMYKENPTWLKRAPQLPRQRLRSITASHGC